MEKEIKVAYVILHFNVIEETLKCVESIEETNYQNYHIVVVDNGSKNGTGEKLKEIYGSKQNITIIINEKNLGFSAGNNVGCDFAITKYNPEYLIVLNNDTAVKTSDIVQKIDKEYENDNFDILAPKIWNTKLKLNQNPHYTVSNLEQAKKRYEDTRKSEYLINKSIFLFVLYKFIIKKMKKKTIDKNPSTKICHGSCIIFSKKYYAKYKKVFDEKTFLYGEEAFLNFRKNKDLLNVVYTEKIEIFHNESVSTKKIMSTWKQKRKFIAHHRHLASKEILTLYTCK